MWLSVIWISTLNNILTKLYIRFCQQKRIFDIPANVFHLRTTHFIYSICLLLLTACSNSGTGERSIPEPDLAQRLRSQKDEIDRLYRKEGTRLELMAKSTVNGNPVPVGDTFMPSEFHTMYEILRNGQGHIISIWEFPMISGGEWNTSYIHYFDSNGRTFAFERQCSFLNSRCTPGVAREVKTEYYNSSFQSVDKMYTLTDAQEKPLQRTECVFPFDFIYQASSDTAEYLKANKIKR